MKKNELMIHEVSNDRIFVVAQSYYGNRTGLELKRSDIEEFFNDCLSEGSVAILKTVLVPGSDNIVVVYDQTREDEYVNEDFPALYATHAAKYRERWGEDMVMHPTCEIPEINFKIHTRCFACRMGENGALQSLENGDGEKYVHYFPIR